MVDIDGRYVDTIFRYDRCVDGRDVRLQAWLWEVVGLGALVIIIAGQSPAAGPRQDSQLGAGYRGLDCQETKGPMGLKPL